MNYVFLRIFAGAAVLAYVCGQPMPQCSEECTRSLLDNSNGPRVLRLFKELMMSDGPEVPKSPMEMNGQQYNISSSKKALVENALKKGLPTDLVEKMFDYAAILPTDTETIVPTTPETETVTVAVRKFPPNDTTELPDEARTASFSTSTLEPRPTTTTESTQTTSPQTENLQTTSFQTENPQTTSFQTENLQTTSPQTENLQTTSPQTTIFPEHTSEPEPENSTFTPPRYRISTKDNGDIVLTINGTDLKMPEELPKLNQIVKNPQLLSKIIDDLKNVGVPIRSRGNQIIVDREMPSAREEPIYVRILTSNGRPFKVVIKSEQEEYQLPGDEDAFNRLLATQPQTAYQILSLLAAHGITAQIDQSRNFDLPGLVPQQPPPVFHGPVTSRNNFLSMSRAPPSIDVGNSHFTFPRDWERLRRQVESETVPAAMIQRALEMNNIDCPPNIFVVIYQNMLKDFDKKLEVIRRNDEIGMNFGARYFRLPREADNLATMMRNNLLACEFVRDALMRIGVESMKDNGGIQIELPRSRRSFFMPDLPSFRMFEYKIVPQPDGSIQITCGPSSYTLPEDQASLQKAFEERKVLPLEMVDAMNKSGIAAKMNYLTQNFEVQNGPHMLRFPVKMETGSPENVKLYSQGKPGSMSFLVEVGNMQLTLPRDVRKLNSLILSNRLDPLRLVELFKQRTYVPYYFDTEKGRHVIVLDGKPLEFVHSASLNNDGSSSDSSEQDG